MTVEYTKNDSKRCPTCGTICIKGAKEFYYCQTCKIDLFDDELKIGKIPNILKTTSIDPQIARWFWDGVKIILLRESSIPRTLKESIAVIVSNANSCKYCTQAHSMLLQLMGFDDDKINDLKNNFENFSDKEKAALN